MNSISLLLEESEVEEESDSSDDENEGTVGAYAARVEKHPNATAATEKWKNPTKILKRKEKTERKLAIPKTIRPRN